MYKKESNNKNVNKNKYLKIENRRRVNFEIKNYEQYYMESYKLFEKLYKKINYLNKKYNNINERLERIENFLININNDYKQSKNADLMIIERLENIADFLKNNYNVVIEEREIFTLNPHDD